MAKVLVTQAAQLVGKSRKSLYRHIKQGKLSVSQNEEGVSLIETSELIRVYGSLRQVETGDKPKSAPQRDSKRDTFESLISELKLLRQEVSSLREELANVKALPAPKLAKEKTESTNIKNKLLNAFDAILNGVGKAVEALK